MRHRPASPDLAVSDLPERPASLALHPIDFPQACDFITRHHRHHPPPQGHKFSIAVRQGQQLAGVVTVGRPVSRHLDDGLTLEITRRCTDGTKNACSKLYGAAWRATQALGYRRLITYTLQEEAGVSLKASGWQIAARSPGEAGTAPADLERMPHRRGQSIAGNEQPETRSSSRPLIGP